MEEALNELKVNNYKEIAKILVKYQKFKSSVVEKEILKLSGLEIGAATVRNYTNYGISYIKYGKISKILPKIMYNYIDENIKNCVSPLTPSEEDKRRERKRDYTKKNVTLPITKTLSSLAPKLTGKFIYGLQMDNRILTFEHESEMKQFINNVKFLSDAKLKPIIIEVEKYEG